MEDDQDQRPESLLPYEDWMEDALRQVMLRAIRHAAQNGLPGQHHFYLTFRTDHPGVTLPPRLRAQYPQEMTIVLQHQFWDLQVDEAGTVRVGLSFGGVPSTVEIPLGAITGFADPSIKYGLRFRSGAATQPEATPPASLPAGEPEAAQSEALQSEAAQPGATAAEAAPQVVRLDAFRRKPQARE